MKRLLRDKKVKGFIIYEVLQGKRVKRDRPRKLRKIIHEQRDLESAMRIGYTGENEQRSIVARFFERIANNSGWGELLKAPDEYLMKSYQGGTEKRGVPAQLDIATKIVKSAGEINQPDLYAYIRGDRADEER